MNWLKVKPGPRARALVVVAAVLLVAATAWWDARAWQRLDRESAITQAREDAVVAASDAVPQMLSYDAKTLDEDVRRSKALLTERFAPEFTELQDVLIRPAVGQRFSTTAVVERIAVTEESRRAVTLLVFLEQSTRRGGSLRGEPVATRASVRMRLVDGDWLVDDLRPA